MLRANMKRAYPDCRSVSGLAQPPDVRTLQSKCIWIAIFANARFEMSGWCAVRTVIILPLVLKARAWKSCSLTIFSYISKRPVSAVQVPYTDIGAVYQLLDQHAAERVSEDYDTGSAADVLITVRVEVTEVQGLVEQTTNATSGRVTPHRV